MTPSKENEAGIQAGALATGSSFDIEPESKPYSEFRTWQPALDAYVRNAESLGRTFDRSSPARRMNRASTDMGNMSQVVPWKAGKRECSTIGGSDDQGNAR